jgi:hypothetical protein
MADTTAGTHLMTEAEYNALSSEMKGYACYMYGEWPGAGAWLKACPFDKERQPVEHAEFCKGEFAAMLVAQELED